jgi:uncharacterized tellurite resistance protein B-like protein
MPNIESNALAALQGPEVDAVIELMLLAASADGHLDTSELEQLRQNLLSVEALRLTKADLDPRILAAAKRIDEAPRSERLSELKKALPRPEQRVAALELVISIINADGVFRMSENELAMEVAQALEVDGRVSGDLFLRRLF